MAVTILFGKGNSGKTSYCFDRLITAADAGKKTVLLVPDQGTYNAERRLAAHTRRHGFMGTRVLGFSRLAYLVLQERNREKNALSDFDKRIVLRRLTAKNTEAFSVLRQAAEQPNFAEILSAFIDECRSFDISAAALQESAAILDEGVLKHKLTDIAFLYGKYEAYLEERFGSARDVFSALAEEAGKVDFLRDAHIWVDGFQWFTPRQLQVLKAIADVSEETVITLPMDPEHRTRQRRPTALYKRAFEAFEELSMLFPAIRVEIVPDYAASELRRFRDTFFAPVPETVKTPVQALQVCECTDRRVEVDAVARRIKTLVQAGRRYRDITVITRSSEPYSRLCERIFAEYDIPCFTDYRRPMHIHPLSEALTALLETVRLKWSQEALFRLLKTDLMPLERRETDDLELYCSAAGIRAYHWYKDEDWQRMPEGLENKGAGLVYINGIRKRVYDLLSPLWEAFAGTDSLRNFCTALWQWLEDAHIGKTLAAWQAEAQEAGCEEEAREHEQVWKKVISLLERLVVLCGDDEMSGAEFTDILTEGLEELHFTLIPPTADHVTVTSIERGYTSRSPVIFVCGVNDGVFPLHHGEDGLLNDKERRALKKAGLSLGPDSRFRIFQERFLFYLALTRADNRVYLSWSLATEGGDALLPSPWVRQLAEKGYVYMIDKEDGSVSEEKAGQYLVAVPKAFRNLPFRLRPAKQGEPVADIWWALYDWACLHGYNEYVRMMTAGLFYKNTAVQLPFAAMNKLFLKNSVLKGSVTLLERYRRCPFAFFVQYGLKLSQRLMYSFTAPDFGTVVHEVLRVIGSELLGADKQWRDLKDEEIEPLCREKTDKIAAEAAGTILFSDAYFMQIKERLIATLVRTVHQLKAFSSVSAFSVNALEKSFGHDEAWKYPEFTLPNGVTVRLTGQIDRIDTLRRDNRTFVLIMDYKSGRKALTLQDVYDGLELQLMIYMAVSLYNLGDAAVPAGAVYCPVRNDIRNEAADPAEEKKKALYMRSNRFAGFYLSETDVAELLDKTVLENSSPFSGLHINQKGVFSSSARVYDEAGWSGLVNLAEARVRKIAEKLTDGRIAVAPARWGKAYEHKACDYCPYTAVCRFDLTAEDGNGWNFATAKKDDEIMKELGGEDNDMDKSAE